MRVCKQILCLIVMLPLGVHYAHAQKRAKSPLPPKYRLELMYVSDMASHEYIFVVGKIRFKSVASLKRFLSGLPPGSIIEWDPGCLRRGGEPLLSSREDMEDFKAFCAAQKIKLVLLPSG